MTFLLTAVFLVAALFGISAEICDDKSTLCARLLEHCETSHWMSLYCKATCNLCVFEPTEVPMTPPANLKIIPGYCGTPQVVGTRVIGGVNAVRGSWPWQILMLYNGFPSCGGALISPHWVVSAAHCVYGEENYANSFTIRTGEHDRSLIEGTEAEHNVEKIITHPDYNPFTLNNDISLLRLTRPVLFNKYVSPVCLPDEPPNVGDTCYITGWGKTKSTGTMTDILQQGKLPVVSQQTCHKLNMANIKIPVTDAMICGGSGGENTLSGCHGDSGGPYVCEKGGRWFLQGAVSHGASDCNSTVTYTVFSKVSYFREWIDETMLES